MICPGSLRKKTRRDQVQGNSSHSCIGRPLCMGLRSTLLSETTATLQCSSTIATQPAVLCCPVQCSSSCCMLLRCMQLVCVVPPGMISTVASYTPRTRQ
jgi:hypothetical protein